jgi:cytochrome c556
MIMRMTRLRNVLALAAGALLLAAGMAHAEAEPEDIIKYRQSVMKANGAHMSAADAILKGKVGYKKDLAYHARAIEAINADVAALFPKGSDFGETKALDAVWEKRADFEKRAKDAAQKSAAFAKAVAANDPQVAARHKELGEACKACHKDFRKEEK